MISPKKKSVSVVFKIKSVYPNLRTSEKKVADYVLRNQKVIQKMSMAALAERTDVSQPTVMRFVKALGFEGYREFKYALIRNEAYEEPFQPLFRFEVHPWDSIEEIPAKTIGTTIGILEDVLKAVSVKSLQGTVEAILRARRIDVYGIENSGVTAYDMANKLLYLGLDCRCYTDSYLQHICAGNLQKEDVAIGISYSGKSQNTVKALKIAKKAGAKTIAITNFPDMPIADFADIVICASSDKAMIYGNAIFSRTSQLAVVDMIYMGILVTEYERFSKTLDKSAKLIQDREYQE